MIIEGAEGSDIPDYCSPPPNGSTCPKLVILQGRRLKRHGRRLQCTSRAYFTAQAVSWLVPFFMSVDFIRLLVRVILHTSLSGEFVLQVVYQPNYKSLIGGSAQFRSPS